MRNNNLIHFDFMVVNYKTVPLTRNNKLVFFLSPNENDFTKDLPTFAFFGQESRFGCKKYRLTDW